MMLTIIKNCGVWLVRKFNIVANLTAENLALRQCVVQAGLPLALMCDGYLFGLWRESWIHFRGKKMETSSRPLRYPRHLQVAMRGAAILKIQVYQCLVGNSVFLRLLFEVFNDVRVQPKRYLLLEPFGVRIPVGLHL